MSRRRRIVAALSTLADVEENKQLPQFAFDVVTRPLWLFGYVTVQEREPEKVFCRAKAKKGLQRRGRLSCRWVGARTGHCSGPSRVRHPELDRAPHCTADRAGVSSGAGALLVF